MTDIRLVGFRPASAAKRCSGACFGTKGETALKGAFGVIGLKFLPTRPSLPFQDLTLVPQLL